MPANAAPPTDSIVLARADPAEVTVTVIDDGTLPEGFAIPEQLTMWVQPWGSEPSTLAAARFVPVKTPVSSLSVVFAFTGEQTEVLHRRHRLVVRDLGSGATWFSGDVSSALDGDSARVLRLALGAVGVSFALSLAAGASSSAVSSVNEKTGAVVLDAADVGALPDTTVIPDVSDLITDEQLDAGLAGRQRVAAAPVLVADGATIPAGATAALLMGSTAVLPDAATHGLGQAMYLTSLGGPVTLSATGSDLIQFGMGLVVPPGLTLTVAANDLDALAPDVISWGNSGTNMNDARVQGLIDTSISNRPTDTEMATAIGDAVEDAVESVSDAALRDFDYTAVAAGLSRDRAVLVPAPMNGQPGAFTAALPVVPTASIEIVVAGVVTEMHGSDWFHELKSITLDGGVGNADSLEVAAFERWTAGRVELLLYIEGTNAASGAAWVAEFDGGATWEPGDWLPETWNILVDAGLRFGNPFRVRAAQTFSTGTVQAFRETATGTPALGRRWLQVGEYVGAVEAGSIYLSGDPVAVGPRFKGEIFDGEVWVDGNRVMAPSAGDWEEGSTFTDAEAVEWSTTDGSVRRSLRDRVAALEGLIP